MSHIRNLYKMARVDFLGSNKTVYSRIQPSSLRSYTAHPVFPQHVGNVGGPVLFKAFLKGCPAARRGGSNLHSLLTKWPFATIEGDLLRKPHHHSLLHHLLRACFVNCRRLPAWIHADNILISLATW